MANSVTFLVSGPTFHGISTGSGGQMEPLGICEGDVRLSFNLANEEVRSDVLGPMVPTEVQYMGVSCSVSGVLVKYSEAVFLKLASGLPNAGGVPGGQVAGIIPPQSLGALYQLENEACRYTVISPYSSKLVFGEMVKGYNFPCAWLGGTHDVSISTRVKRIQFTMMTKIFYSITNAGVSGVLWNQDVSGFPPLSAFNP